MRKNDYFRLVDETGRVQQRGKRGRIDPTVEPILDRLGITMDDWQSASTYFQHSFRNGKLRVQKVS